MALISTLRYRKFTTMGLAKIRQRYSSVRREFCKRSRISTVFGEYEYIFKLSAILDKDFELNSCKNARITTKHVNFMLISMR